MNEPQATDAAPLREPSPREPTWPRHPVVRIGMPLVAIILIAGAILLLRDPGKETTYESAELREARLGALSDGAPQVGQPAPDFALRALDGQVVRLSELRGRIVLLNFWATWCGPCRMEMPDLQAVYEQHSDELVVLAVNVEGAATEEARRLAADFRDEHGLTFPIVLDTPDGEVFTQYKLKGLPDSFFIDREGIIRAVIFGPMSRDTILKKLEQTRTAR